MQDPSGRTISYLRLSLVKACQMRCVYCRPDGNAGLCDDSMLTSLEIDKVVRHMVQNHGVRKVRLTGGDPTARPDLVQIIEQITAIPDIDDLAMTTNGLNLAKMAQTYANAGLDRINISLDSLDPVGFEKMTGVDGLHHVLKGIDAAMDAGFKKIKINTVVLRNQNDHEILPLIKYAAQRNIEIRFIELMPLGPLAPQWEKRYISAQEISDKLELVTSHWQAFDQGASSAQRYKIKLQSGQEAIIGFITPMSCAFCAACNRLRIASDGLFYPCLMDDPGGSLMPAIRPTFDSQKFDQLLKNGLQRKAEWHPAQGSVVMTHIGG